MLINISELLHSGVYFLIYKKEIVYIGASDRLLFRIADHKMERDIPFDEVQVILCNSPWRLELALIKEFRPRYNRIIKGYHLHVREKRVGTMYSKGKRNKYNQTMARLAREGSLDGGLEDTPEDVNEFVRVIK